MISISSLGQEIDVSSIPSVNGQKTIVLKDLVIDKNTIIKILKGTNYFIKMVGKDMYITFDENSESYLVIFKDIRDLLNSGNENTLIQIVETDIENSSTSVLENIRNLNTVKANASITAQDVRIADEIDYDTPIVDLQTDSSSVLETTFSGNTILDVDVLNIDDDELYEEEKQDNILPIDNFNTVNQGEIPDTKAPEAPSVKLSDDGKKVTGTAEPGSLVTIKDKDGNVLGTATADQNGNYSVSLSTALTNGEQVNVTAKDKAGNESEKTSATAPDTTAPETPSAKLSDDGKKVTGTAEPGSLVTIKDKDGNVLGIATADENGNYSVSLNTPLTNGEQVSATATDKAGNESEKTSVTAPDTTAPETPTATVTPDGTKVTGNAEPGSKVKVTLPDGSIKETTANPDGTYTIPLDTPLKNGEKVTATATDKAGNTSDQTPANAKDTTAPNTPSASVSDNGTQVTGKAEPNSKVTIKDKDGNVLGTATADENGNYVVPLNKSLKNGEKVSATATDKAGNESTQTDATAKDTTAPNAPSASVAPDGTKVTGSAEPGSTVTIKDKEGNVLGTATADENGNYTVPLSTPLKNGEQISATATDKAGNTSDQTPATAPDTTAPTLSATLSDDGKQIVGKTEPGATVKVDTNGDGQPDATTTADENGNYTINLKNPVEDGKSAKVTANDGTNDSVPQTVTNPDTAAPYISIAGVSDSGNQVTGKAEAGSTVTIKDKDGNVLGTATADENGNYAVSLNKSLTNGEQISATAKDSSNNESKPVFKNAKDSTAPDAPSATVSDNGTQVTGKAEPNSKVTIKDKDGNVLGTATADENGNYTVPLSSALTNGEKVSATATDKAGNESAQTAATAKDTTPPQAPSATVSDNGTQVTGKAEAGSTVTIKDENGKVLGTATADENGNYTVPLSPALTNGEKVSATAKDKAGNTSDQTDATAKDTTPPQAPSAAVSDNGTQVTGKAEVGSTVTIKDKDGNVLGTAVADENGDYVVNLSNPITNGENITAVATDKAGNPSDQTPATAPDKTAPNAPTASVAQDGTQVTGKAEPGSKVTIKDKDGKVLGTATADENGNYTVPLSPALTNGEKVTATATDKAGNTSDQTPAIAPDTTAPTLSATLSDDGKQIVGKTEPGATVKVDTDDDGQPDATTTADENGNYVINLQTPIEDGKSAKVTANDGTNDSSPQTVTNPDTAAPNAPTITSFDGEIIQGKAEPNSKITIKDKDGNIIGAATADANGDYKVTLQTKLTNREDISATATDKAGNESDPTYDKAPQAVHISKANSDGVVVDLPDADPNDTVTVKYEKEGGGTETITLTKQSGGSWKPSSSLPSEIDSSGNTTTSVSISNSKPYELLIPSNFVKDDTQISAAPSTGTGTVTKTMDKSAPSEPSINQPNGDTDAEVTLPTDAKTGDKVTITYETSEGVKQIVVTKTSSGWNAPSGVNLNSGKVIIPKEQIADNTEIKAFSSDEAGNKSTTAKATMDKTDPLNASIDSANEDGVVMKMPLSSKEGDVVKVTTSDGKTLTLTKKADGTWTATSDGTIDTSKVTIDGDKVTIAASEVTDGSTITATSTDKAGNVADNPPTATMDKTDPTAATINQANKDGVEIGLPLDAKEGDKVEVKYTDEDGNEQTVTLTKNASGGWDSSNTSAIPNTTSNKATLPANQVKDGTQITATSIDKAGNKAEPAKAVMDETAPEQAVVEKANNEDGIIVSLPPAEKGDTVEITYTKNDGTPVTEVLEKQADGTWTNKTSGGLFDVSDPTKAVISPAKVGTDVKHESEVKAVSKDSAGNEAPPSSDTVYLDKKDPYDATVVYDQSSEKATITLPKEPSSPDSTKEAPKSGDTVVVEYTNENGENKTATLTYDGTSWSSNDTNVIVGNVSVGNGGVTIANSHLKDNTKIKVTAKDKAGNEQDTPREAIVDKTIPNDPVINSANENGVEIALPTNADENDTVEIKYKDETGALQTVILTKQADGSWNSDKPSLIANISTGSNNATIDATKVEDSSPITAQAYNNGTTPNPQKATAIMDKTDPTAATINQANKDGVEIGLPTTAKEGDKVEVKYTDEDGNEQTVTLTKNGSGGWDSSNPSAIPNTTSNKATLPANQVKDGTQITATSIDKAGNTATPAEAVMDETAPLAPEITQANGKGVEIALPPANKDDTVEIKYTDETGSLKTAILTKQANGTWNSNDTNVTIDSNDPSKAIINANQVKDGAEVTAQSKDPAGNTSDVDKETMDETPLKAPEITQADENGVKITMPDDAEQGDKVVIKYTDESGNEQSVTLTKNSSGGWDSNNTTLIPSSSDNNLSFSSDKIKANSPLSATSVDKAGNEAKDTEIVDKNPPKISIDVDSNVSDTPDAMSENNSNSRLEYTVKLSKTSSNPTQVTVKLSGNADSSDYTFNQSENSGVTYNKATNTITLTIAAGQTTASFKLGAVDDTPPDLRKYGGEGNEQVIATIQENLQAYQIDQDKGSSTGVIIDSKPVALEKLWGDYTTEVGPSEPGTGGNGDEDPNGAKTTDLNDSIYIGYFMDGSPGGGLGNVSVFGSSKPVTIDTAKGDDLVKIRGSLDANTEVILGDGNDRLYLEGITSTTAKIEGGSGVDELHITGNNATHISSKNIEGIEHIYLDNAKGVFDLKYSELLADNTREGALYIHGDSNDSVNIIQSGTKGILTYPKVINALKAQGISESDIIVQEYGLSNKDNYKFWHKTGVTESKNGATFDQYKYIGSAYTNTDDDATNLLYIQQGIEIS